MIVIYGSIRVRAEDLEEISKLAAAFVAEVHKEAGCLAYELSWDVADPQRLRLVEHWADEATYEAHRVQPHVATWARAITAAAETKLVSAKFNATPR